MTAFRTKTANGITKLQRRKWLFFWTTITLGAWAAMASKAVRLQRQHERGRP